MNLSEAKLAEVQNLINIKQKIKAIQVVREATGCGLSEAKTFVDQLEAGNIPPANESNTSTDVDQYYNEIRALLYANKRAEAVNVLYQLPDWSIQRAHDYVYNMEIELFGEDEVKRRHQIVCPQCGSTNIETVRKTKPAFIYNFIIKLQRHCLECDKRW